MIFSRHQPKRKRSRWQSPKQASWPVQNQANSRLCTTELRQGRQRPGGTLQGREKREEGPANQEKRGCRHEGGQRRGHRRTLSSDERRSLRGWDSEREDNRPGEDRPASYRLLHRARAQLHRGQLQEVYSDADQVARHDLRQTKRCHNRNARYGQTSTW